MRITILILVAAIMQVSAASYAQKISLSEKKAPIAKVFIKISQQSGYEFMVTGSMLKHAKPVTIDVSNMELSDVLQQVFEGQPLAYTVAGNIINVNKREPASPGNLKNEGVNLAALPANVTGQIVDSLNRPLTGASVRLKGTGYHALTDNRGNFTFSSLPQGKYTIIVTYIGYTPLETDFETGGRALKLNLVMRIATSSLDQVLVIGYGAESKRFSVGSVSAVTAEQIEKQPVTNPLLALQGQVSGLNITATNGVPGSTTLVQIRGQNSLGLDSRLLKPYDQPLFIIDGVPSATGNTNISQLSGLSFTNQYSGGISQPTGISPFNNINPNDIESITILKDADATSIYGSKGANGVVLITTKKGKAGKTVFNFNLNTQFNSVAKPVKLLNTQQYLQYRKDAFDADGLTPSINPNDPGYAPDLTIYDQNKYTDWAKVIAGNTTHNTDLHASVSGGTGNNTFIVSGGYTRSDYNYPGDFADQRFTLHSALHSASADRRFTLDLVTDYGYDQNHSAGFGGNQDVLLAPDFPDLLDAAGKLIWSYNGVSYDRNFYSSVKKLTDLASYNFNSSANLSYQIAPGLSILTNLGYSRNTATEHSINPSTAQDPLHVRISAGFANNAAQTINVEPQLNYNKSMGKSVLSTLLGFTYRKNSSYSSLTLANGYVNDNFLGSVNGAATTSPFENLNTNKYSAAFVRVKYVYDQKYIIEISGRRDGSSNFGPGRRFGNFGSVGAGWIFSDEQVFKEALPFFSFGKLTGSYGTVGADASKAYAYQALYQTLSGIPDFQGIKQSYPYNLYNPDFSWATKKSLNLALDFGFFNNRLLLNTTYYRNREGDQLVDYPLSAQTGFSSVYGNLDAVVQNKGWEFTVTSTHIKTRKFSWTTNFNLSFNRNKLLAFPNLEASSYANKYIIGEPASIIFGYSYKGVNPATGLFEFYDRNGNATSSPKFGTAAQGGDQVPISNREINYMGGIGNNFSYKRFSLYIFCQFSSGNQPNFLSAIYNSTSPGTITNEPEYILGKYWRAPGDNATLQRLAANFSSASLAAADNFLSSSGAYSRDTYLRVKTVALSYALPDTFLKKVHIQSAGIYMNAQNLFTLTNYRFGDPEQPGSLTFFPLQRIVALGLRLNF